MPYRYLEDIATADVAFEAWGATGEELFIAAADALLATMANAPGKVERKEELIITLEHEEPDLLLWSFLQELIFLKDARRLLLHADTVSIAERGGVFTLKALLRGEEINSGRHQLLVDVKAATLHRLQLTRIEDQWRATVVLDV
ncbi:MAG TPA: archease [Geobacteraceae bacterium]|nr:archease [Geobacteraceae bacterium]